MFLFFSQFMRQLVATAGIPEELLMTTIDSEASLAACLEQSQQGGVFILKHSTRCPISTSALREVRAYLEEAGEAGPKAFINYVVENRAQSNALADTLGVPHASPQIFLVDSGTVSWHSSHGGITRGAMTSAYEALAQDAK